MQKLSTFSPHELRLLLCGEQAPNWSREDVLRFTEPRFGYTKDRYMSLGLWSLAMHSRWLAGWLCLAGIGDHVSVSMPCCCSEGYQRFVNVLVKMNADERKVSL